ncbi:hypothetical protein HYX10_02885 [Candidatus Woesearchaeota archaeon]|nr:hypothetical protein [Candidatus Woesearchaeota archaeon]
MDNGIKPGDIKNQLGKLLPLANCFENRDWDRIAADVVIASQDKGSWIAVWPKRGGIEEMVNAGFLAGSVEDGYTLTDAAIQKVADKYGVNAAYR